MISMIEAMHSAGQHTLLLFPVLYMYIHQSDVISRIQTHNVHCCSSFHVVSE